MPGPRRRIEPRPPVGLESLNGASISVLNGTFDGGMGPNYSNTEIGASVQLGVVGADVTVDPLEILDCLAGFIFLDITDDDL